MAFNLSRLKLAQQRGRFPSELLPSESERGFLANQNPYRLHAEPNDGQGQKLTTPSSIGMPGTPSSGGSGFGGSNERKGYPRGVSQHEDTDMEFDNLPSDWDPEDPFSEVRTKEQYGDGQGSNYGEALHDDSNVNTGDSVLGIHQTVMNDLSGNERDRKTDIATMQGADDNPFEKRRHRYNHRLSKKGPMNFVRSSQ